MLSIVRISRLNWIGHVNGMDSKIKVTQVFNNNPQGIRLIEGPKKQMVKLQTDINNCKITNLEEKSKSRADRVKSTREAKVRIGL